MCFSFLIYKMEIMLISKDGCNDSVRPWVFTKPAAVSAQIQFQCHFYFPAFLPPPLPELICQLLWNDSFFSF